ncbi:long-chain fatty acid--CoA ligase [Sporosarcina sp. FSL W7-1349]|uniref:class I adenylate-forming enzyme family protein n=1 Tax=Sporosarcina sp. FSL W7-1349 TaxID=2921561 RepID=UPI0030FA74BA
MNVIHEITRFSISSPDKIALKNLHSTITYEELEQKINQTANAFLSFGVEKGERILIQIGNRFEFIYCYYAAMKIGAIIVPINPLYTPNEMSFIVEDCQPVVYVCEQLAKNNIETVNKHSENVKKIVVLDDKLEELNFERYMTEQSGVYEANIEDDDAVCQILYTSGTTGHPKGAMLTHDGLAGNAKTYSEHLKCTSDDIGLIVAPLYHAAAQTNCLNTMILSNAGCYIMEKFVPIVVLDTMEKEQITYFFGPPTMYAMLLNDPNIENYQFNLRIAFTGAASMPVSVHKRWKELFGFDILEGYGLTECSPVVSNHGPDGPIKHGSIGPAIEGVSVKIFDENDQEVPVGEIGEVVVQGPNVMKGYWNRPEATKEALRGGWFHTGDVGYQDEDGYFYIVDRKKDMINQGGLKIYPREIEEILYQYGSFLEVGVVGEPDAIKGEQVVAYVTLKDSKGSVDFEDVEKFCRKNLAPYKIPKKYYVLDEMPKTLSGKILKTQLVKA